MRFLITGPTGSGKTTLARHVSARSGIPVQSLDDLHWVRSPHGDYRRAPEERSGMLEFATSRASWIVEGVQFKWADVAIERSDCIIVLDLPRWRNLSFIARRFLDRRSGKVDGRGSLTALWQEVAWHRDYHHHERDMLLAKLRPWSGKVIIASSPADAGSQIWARWPSHPDPA